MTRVITLKWREPYDGWIDHDTGLCNRILHWEIAHEIAKLHKPLGFSIELEKRHWPEHRLIYLPETNFFTNTKFKSNNQYDLEFRTVYDFKQNIIREASPITKEMISDIKNHKKIDFSRENYWYSDFGFDTLIKNDRYMFINTQRGLKHIKLVHKKYEEHLKSFAKNCVGIHIRRGNGVNITETDILSLPPNIQSSYREQVKKYTLDIYGFIKDEVYFKIIDEILKITPTQKFFISHDQPYEFMVHYKERYPKNVIFKEDIMPHIKNFFRNISLDTDELNEGKALDNVTDLFTLSFCEFIITSNISTWSHFAMNYNKPITIDAESNLKDILNLYRENSPKPRLL